MLEIIRVPETTVEVVSDSGEGAQKCGQIFGSVCAKMGNGAWTVEIIPAEIQPPPRTPAGGSGNRIRFGTEEITNWGDAANLVVAFNEQVLLGRIELDALAHDAIVLLENMWKTHADETIQKEWEGGLEKIRAAGYYKIVEVPMEEECLKIVDDARRGKNMFALGLLTCIYDRDVELVKAQIAHQFRKKGKDIYERNVELMELGYKWASKNLDFRIDVPTVRSDVPKVVMNGNEAIGMGAIAAGMQLCAMYPITPATSASHYLGEAYDKFGGVVHQAEDEIAAVGVAIGASYAGKVAFTITSGPGLSLKQEFIGLAVMLEVPLVVVDVQRGGPSTGLPTKAEQSDLMAAMFGQHGDAPHVVMAPATIEECFHIMVTARRIAETFRTTVIVLSDANLATGVQPFPRPKLDTRWLQTPLNLTPWPENKPPYDWDEQTGLSQRVIPGQPGGEFAATGLSHTSWSKVAYDPESHQQGCQMRSRKLAVLQQALQPPEIYGVDSGDLPVVGSGSPKGTIEEVVDRALAEYGDLLLVGWGSTKGAIEEAVDRARAEGLSVSSIHLSFLSPLPPGLEMIFCRFDRVMTVEINYSDEPDDPYISEENRRYSQLAFLLRAQTLVDVDCWSRVPGQPLRPGEILNAVRQRLRTGVMV
ncbi:MAG: 2-oxoacid:acceptor oxidoreductase family protein [Gemmatimonadota bacterium]|nr:MAG: 2-oxoacid:acceptor oxidoreductase family protein [Gemmatimonadota bacterium]